MASRRVKGSGATIEITQSGGFDESSCKTIIAGHMDAVKWLVTSLGFPFPHQREATPKSSIPVPELLNHVQVKTMRDNYVSFIAKSSLLVRHQLHDFLHGEGWQLVGYTAMSHHEKQPGSFVEKTLTQRELWVKAVV